ncbi:uncharacterized protein LOC135499858 isoform X2 [Lineus longissimus]|uniref:uncharacterized protein LOC135499858 isoform X2 n=1 Tax=Lineus longissimus TaxID=88925 RepID=UPI00315E0275
MHFIGYIYIAFHLINEIYRCTFNIAMEAIFKHLYSTVVKYILQLIRIVAIIVIVSSSSVYLPSWRAPSECMPCHVPLHVCFLCASLSHPAFIQGNSDGLCNQRFRRVCLSSVLICNQTIRWQYSTFGGSGAELLVYAMTSKRSFLSLMGYMLLTSLPTRISSCKDIVTPPRIPNNVYRLYYLNGSDAMVKNGQYVYSTSFGHALRMTGGKHENINIKQRFTSGLHPKPYTIAFYVKVKCRRKRQYILDEIEKGYRLSIYLVFRALGVAHYVRKRAYFTHAKISCFDKQEGWHLLAIIIRYKKGGRSYRAMVFWDGWDVTQDTKLGTVNGRWWGNRHYPFHLGAEAFGKHNWKFQGKMARLMLFKCILSQKFIFENLGKHVFLCGKLIHLATVFLIYSYNFKHRLFVF